MNEKINKNILFYGSCFALITTALTFSIRAGILPQLGDEFGLTAEQLGFINSMWFFGFPISMILGGIFYNSIGPKNIMRIAFVSHVIGILMTIYAGGYTTLLISTLFIGFGNGCTEAACNPMIADSYKGNMVDKMLNRFHMWFPGGIVLGSLISKFMTDANMGWQAQIWIMLIPAVIYFILFLGQNFPKPKLEEMKSLTENFKALGSPVFLFLFFTMAITAITEFGPQQWVSVTLSESGASPMIILALVTGLMAVGRWFAGPVIATLGQTGVLLGGAIFSAIGIYMFSVVTGPMAYVAAIFFAIGVCYFWPTMVGAAAKRAPVTGALGLSLIGGMGMFSSAIFQPVIGGWIDDARVTAESMGLTGSELELVAGQVTLTKMVMFPAILIVLFIIFYIWQKKADIKTVDEMAQEEGAVAM
ncbi:MFS transporter [Membranicola marinus]|uniref:MFS transporter n=1 Tax=Membranihabitans marinus TaxID=1227546 RepID=A0A953HKI7_9BACT|nr:MFS transporter [Membranihabitans marinus]MBY5956734.1 MFS transporter [Membranihabitans marinus]